ncbi:MAG: nucleotidyltransferase domain-containing protein [Candidatus Aenigmarchaeota archaeon]|nr:nucleotidyltransferase domain-containing protein [Candidatus Aenigmarchaeota archaeon]
MVEENLKDEIEKDFEFLKKDIFSILIFGSYVRGEQTKRSDIDICLVVGNGDKKKVWKEILKSGLTEKYDIKIFETMPLKLKGEVIESSEIIWSKNVAEHSYYLFKWRKIWEDQKIALRKLGFKIFH